MIKKPSLELGFFWLYLSAMVKVVEPRVALSQATLATVRASASDFKQDFVRQQPTHFTVVFS